MFLCRSSLFLEQVQNDPQCDQADKSVFPKTAQQARKISDDSCKEWDVRPEENANYNARATNSNAISVISPIHFSACSRGLILKISIIKNSKKDTKHVDVFYRSIASSYFNIGRKITRLINCKSKPLCVSWG